MPWWAAVDRTTGRLHSVGSVLADTIPARFIILILPRQLDQDSTVAWNELTVRWEVIATGLPVTGITIQVP